MCAINKSLKSKSIAFLLSTYLVINSLVSFEKGGFCD
ncbi:hypothetical protein D9A24_04880 [Vibrio parahaemolyticus]|nr:hypothetical protein [Vibrio parahaemolyticus]EGR1360466.1 hypothetical protein [Vibrio parahaemolyticus]TBT49225.1 hypothetical protein D5E78_16425 [Vibrio parahaemolyticus]HAS6577200.1 hypothetical protein [Vibrio parahaemolyticus]HAS6584092.1 hypothetical protein [Vibrio parahaemolyticus]